MKNSKKHFLCLILIICIFFINFLSACEKTIQTDSESRFNFKLYGTDRIISDLTPENYPKIGNTEYTLRLNQKLFEYNFSADGDNFISAHILYPRMIYDEKELNEKLKKNELDLFFIEKKVNDTEFDPNLKYTIIGETGLSFLTSDQNKAVNLTLEDIKKIYLSKEISDWGSLGGDKGKIKLTESRFTEFPAEALFKKYLNINESIYFNEPKINFGDTYRFKAYSTYNETTDYVLEYYLSGNYIMGLTADSIFSGGGTKALSIEGIQPSYDTIKSGEYPFSFIIYAVTLKDLPEQSNAEIIVNWFVNDKEAPTVTIAGGVKVIDFKIPEIKN